ncbi:TonB-dependent receptor [Chitinophagaceae bacterium LB-8]|uniref:TonB-dependent receptor n=1 Tax=Paraflavisolibacter caeni TaxID=2982496 RepID=A0A9X3BHJ0_9BACT|nr:TonB-dependent receptor [Paraflavisolibacter caeni]MCU7549727.1 TonB-dependent receptor [Paraflavisolibacter caeni]
MTSTSIKAAFYSIGFIVLLLFFSPQSFAQTGNVSGTILDQDGKPMVGATVRIKGTNKAAITKEGGVFSFNNVSVNGTLIVSHIGYTTMETSFASDKVVSVSLKESVAAVDEVIVTGVFDKRTRMEASVAISTLSAKQINRLTPTSAADLLKNVPGVFVNSSLGEIRNTVYSRGVSVGSNDGASGYYYVSMQEDGLPVTNATYVNYGPDYFNRPDATLGRLEAVRGGTASITSSNAPGGIFNYVSKTGGEKFEGEVRAKYGLEGNGRNPYYRGDVNIGGPLSRKLNLFYNLGGFYRYGTGARDPGYALNRGGQLKANILKRYKTGSLKLYAKYLNDHNGWFEFTPTVSFTDPKPASGFSPYSSVLLPSLTQSFLVNSNPNDIETYHSDNLIHSIDRAIGLNWEQRFGTGWTFQNNFRYSNKESNWNTTAVVYPMSMDNPVTYAVLGLLGRFGTYSFRNATTGQEYGSVMQKPNIINGQFAGFNFNVLNSNFPGKEISPNSFFFQPLAFSRNQVKEVLDQFSLTKKLKNMSFTAGGFYGHSDIDILGGFGAAQSLGTIQNNPQSVNITLTGLDGKVYDVTNGNGMMNIGAPQSAQKPVQDQLAFFFGHNWQMNDKLNLDWGIRYERVKVKGSNALAVANPLRSDPTYGGLDNNPLTIYDNANGTLGNQPGIDFFTYDQSMNTLSYSAGLNYKFNNNFSLYGRYSDGKKSPDLGFFNGLDTKEELDNLEPRNQRVQQMELGVKMKRSNLNLFATPFYSILSNVPEQVLGNNNDGTVYVTPALFNKIVTKGIELEGDYSFAKYFNVRAVATVQTSEAKDYQVWILNGNGAADDEIKDFSGNETDNNANLILNVTPSYNREKFYAQLNWSYLGARQANVANAFELPAFSQFNFAAGYDVTKRLQLSLNINNLTNKYGVMSWSRPGTFPGNLDRQGFTEEMLKANPNAPYSTVAIPARAYFLTATFKF